MYSNTVYWQYDNFRFLVNSINLIEKLIFFITCFFLEMCKFENLHSNNVSYQYDNFRFIINKFDWKYNILLNMFF